MPPTFIIMSINIEERKTFIFFPSIKSCEAISCQNTLDCINLHKPAREMVHFHKTRSKSLVMDRAFQCRRDYKFPKITEK